MHTVDDTVDDEMTSPFDDAVHDNKEIVNVADASNDHDRQEQELAKQQFGTIFTPRLLVYCT